MPYIDFVELKKAVPITDVLKMLDIKDLKPSGRNQLRGICPICEKETNRGFVVTPEKGLWFCFSGCGGGDSIKLVANIKRIGTKEAAELIASHFGTVNSNREQLTVSKPRATAPQNEKAGFNPLTYLEATHEAVQVLGVSAETCGRFGAGYAPKGILRGRMAIPIHDKVGLLLAYCGRTVKDESPTLTFPNGFQAGDVIFNAHRVTEGELYLVRDPLQVLTAYESGIENVVSFLTEAISAQQLEQLASLMDEKHCETVVLF